MKKLTYRYLKGYALDPGFSTQLDTMTVNEAVYKIRWEDVLPGPIGEYIEVIDHDPPSKCFYAPVDLDSTEVLSQGGLSPSEGNPQFHQQMVYAVVMKNIWHFEQALGRKIIWNSRQLFDSKKKTYNFEDEYVGALRIYPHAFRDANAYYDQEKMALLFGYFIAEGDTQGSNMPGGVVFTCLSPDIVAHESTHAILDSIHNRFMEDTNVDVPAFHEGFSDIIALLQRFTFKELVEHQLASTQGSFDKYSVLGELATQFGHALGQRGALRSAIGGINEKTGKWEKIIPNPDDYNTLFECHDRGAILVATIFDAFSRLYHYRTQDLLRIASDGTGILPVGNIPVDLVKRLAAEATEIAVHLLHICIRALDYCPPLDIDFGNYLRALITADIDVAPEDENGYRVALIEAFRARGIFPDRVNTLSTESLSWSRPDFTPKEQLAFEYIGRWLTPRIQPLITMTDRKQLYVETQKLQAEFKLFLEEKKRPNLGEVDWEALLNKLGMTSKPVTFKYEGKSYVSTQPLIEVHKIRPAFRTGREGRQIQQVIITFSQTIRFNVGETGKKQTLKFRGGCTLVLSLSDLNVVEYAIMKNVRSQHRFDKQMAYQGGSGAGGSNLSGSIFDDDTQHSTLSFKNLHFH